MSPRILARGKPAAKWSQNGRWSGVRLLDSTWIIGGKCELSNGSGKSPGLNQFAIAYGETAFAVSGWREILGDFFLFCAKHTVTVERLQTFPEGRVGRFRAMKMVKIMKKMSIFSKKTIGSRVVSLLLAVLSAGVYAQVPAASAGKGNLATITGHVTDNKGNPVSGALISLLREGASKVIKQTHTDVAGRFSARISPGRYGIRAIASGFNEVVFASVEVRASQELVYRFNLEPIGSGNTLPERRKDRDDVKWTLRSAQTRRSIFQVQEGEDAEIHAILGREPAAQTETPADGVAPEASSAEVSSQHSQRRIQGVVETYFAGNSYGPGYPGLNFAIAASPNDRIELIFAGQTTAGTNGPERFEASTHIRAGLRHRMEMSLGAVRYGSPVWISTSDNASSSSGTRPGQISVRAIEEWAVRDGIGVVLGLDYSRFIGAGGAQAGTPRIGLQYDANAMNR